MGYSHPAQDTHVTFRTWVIPRIKSIAKKKKSRADQGRPVWCQEDTASTSLGEVAIFSQKFLLQPGEKERAKKKFSGLKCGSVDYGSCLAKKKGLLRPWTNSCSLKICARCACQTALASTVPYMHLPRKPTNSRSSPFSRASLSFSRPLEVFTKHSSHEYSTEVRTAHVVHCKGSLTFRFFMTVRDEQREESRHTFQRWHSAEAFSCRGNIGFRHALLDLSHDQSRPLVRSTRTTLVGVDPTQGHCLGSFCSHVLTKDGLAKAHATAKLDFLLSCVLDSFCFKHSATHVVNKGVLCQAIFMW